MQMDKSSETVLRNHTPRHLQARIPAIAAMDRFTHAASIPVRLLTESKFLSTVYHPFEIPMSFIILNEKE